MTDSAASRPERVAYKVLSAEQLAAWRREGVFRGSPADFADGYIHLSLASQLPGTLDKHYSGQDDLVLAAIDLVRLGEALRWEKARGDERFPHVYGAISTDAVIATAPVERTADGGVRLPDQAARAAA